MSRLFEPPAMVQKPKKRIVFKMPQEIQTKYFVWIYVGSILLWMIFMMLAMLVIFLLLPFLHVYLTTFWQISASMMSVGLGVIFGTMMGSLLIKEMIQIGIQQGDIKTH